MMRRVKKSAWLCVVPSSSLLASAATAVSLCLLILAGSAEAGSSQQQQQHHLQTNSIYGEITSDEEAMLQQRGTKGKEHEHRAC